MKDKILYQQHIMWYESKMISETLDSLSYALKHSKLGVDLKFCLNSQTYLEEPIDGKAEDMFDEFLHHPILKEAEIVYKTNDEPFYNIGDWRREVYDKNYKYTVWGESDCLLPMDFFYILSEIQIQPPHILSFASRKMWDSSWDCVEHKEIEKYKREIDNRLSAPKPYNSSDIITQWQLDNFNGKCPIEVALNGTVKIDGSLLCISNGIDFQFIGDDMNFVREDFCAEMVFKIKRIPQYVVKTRIKGHNYSHPLKRTNTNAKRTDDVFKQYEQKSTQSMKAFINSLIEKQ
jgi:hypothetical protein